MQSIFIVIRYSLKRFASNMLQRIQLSWTRLLYKINTIFCIVVLIHKQIDYRVNILGLSYLPTFRFMVTTHYSVGSYTNETDWKKSICSFLISPCKICKITIVFKQICTPYTILGYFHNDQVILICIKFI